MGRRFGELTNQERAVRTHRKAALVAAVSAALLGQAARAASEDFEWKGTDGGNPTSWDLTSLNWDRVAPAATGIAWSNNASPATPNRAFFLASPTPGSVSVNAAIDTSAINFAVGGWTLSGGSGDLSFGSNGGTLTLNNVGSNSINANVVDRTNA